MDNELRQALTDIDSRLQALEETQRAQKEAAEATLELYQNIQGVLSLMKVLERVSIWIAKISAAGAILWFVFKESVKHTLRGS